MLAGERERAREREERMKVREAEGSSTHVSYYRAMVRATQDAPACFEFEVFSRTRTEAREPETRVAVPRPGDVWRLVNVRYFSVRHRLENLYLTLLLSILEIGSMRKTCVLVSSDYSFNQVAQLQVTS